MSRKPERVADYRIAADALTDLEAIAEYIFADNPVRSVSFIDEIIERFGTIADRPTSFPVSADLPPGIRSALHGQYRIIFEIVEGIPHFLRVLHGARDISRLL